MSEKPIINQAYLLNREEWQRTLSLSKRNPAYMMKAGLDYLVNIMDGKLDFVDASTPASLVMEFGATLAANNFNYFASADRHHYPVMATSLEDLYHHMSHRLYEGRFATPSRGLFTLVVKRSEILKHAVATEIKGLRKLMIPRGTIFQADGHNFTLLTAVEIRVSAYDAIQAIYSGEYADPYEKISSNILEYYFAVNPEYEEECLYLELPLMQVDKTRIESPITHAGNIYSEIHPYKDEFIQARVYLSDAQGKETEIAVTQSEGVYNPHEVTARVIVLSNNLVKVNIPIIYYNLEKVHDVNVIVELYTTKGRIDIPLKTISEESGIGIDMKGDDTLRPSDNAYIIPWSQMDYTAFCRDDNAGGSNGVPFERLKKWVIEGGRTERHPITMADLSREADLRGYEIVLDIDNVTNRVFQATRELEKSPTGEFHRGVGCSIESVPVIVDELAGHSHVRAHGERLTILPTAMFKTVNGRTVLLSDTEVPTLQNSGNIDSYINEINELEYIFTPFYYCLDSTDGFNMRAYHMDDPRFLAQSYVKNNPATQLLVAVDQTSIKRVPEGYILRIRTRSSDSYKEIPYQDLFAQLAFVPVGQYDLAYINGEFIGLEDDNHVWEFKLETTFDFTPYDHLIFNNFKILSTEYRTLPCELTQWFGVFFGVYDYPIDESVISENFRLGMHLLDIRRKAIGLAENQVKLELGVALKNLWKNARTTHSEKQFKRHTSTQYLTYTENIYRRGEDGLPVVVNGDNDSIDFEIEHRIGDRILDEQGMPIIKHREGDIVIGKDGQPVVVKPKAIQRILDIFFIDGIYRFSTSEEDISYAKSIAKTVVNWLETDIKEFKQRLLERTELYFSPKRTMGYVNILTENSSKRTIFNRLPFRVKFYLTHRAYMNEDYKRSLTQMTYKVINDILRNKTISKDVIEHKLREEGGLDNILGVNVIDMGLGSSVNTFTVLGRGNQCSVRRRISLQADGTLKVKEDINIEFVDHERSIFEKGNE